MRLDGSRGDNERVLRIVVREVLPSKLLCGQSVEEGGGNPDIAVGRDRHVFSAEYVAVQALDGHWGEPPMILPLEADPMQVLGDAGDGDEEHSARLECVMAGRDRRPDVVDQLKRLRHDHAVVRT
jgi:hypothetical protein